MLRDVTGSRQVPVRAEADVARVRAAVREAVAGCSPDLVHAAELVATELATNAVLHGEGEAAVTIAVVAGTIRLDVTDGSPRAPLVGSGSTDGMTGRGLGVVARLATRWGVEVIDGGKVVWAELEPSVGETATDRTEEELLAAWPDRLDDRPSLLHVTLGEVPTDLLVAAKRHVDNLLREFALASMGERTGTTAPVPASLAELIESVVHRFAEARGEIKRQATAAARAGALHTVLELDLPLDVADAAQEYAAALDALDDHSRANRLLTLETPPRQRIFRRWYIGEIVAQLRAAQEGRPGPRPVRFEERLLEEVEVAERARRAADRAARHYNVVTALAAAHTFEDVVAVVLREGVAALGASGGAVLLEPDADADADEPFGVAGTLGYDEATVARLREERRDADLPAAECLRTGEPVWLEAVEQTDGRFRSLATLEPGTRSLCALPVRTGMTVVGALRFSFRDRRLFADEERRFALALAAEASEALLRIELAAAERESRRRLENEWVTIEKLAAVGEAMLRGRDLPTLVQLATDAGTQVAGAQFGAFFYNQVDERGESYTLYALSGAPREAFETFPLPRNTEIFGPTFAGTEIVRLDDVTADPRYGRSAPYHGLPEGHLPVRSYLAVPVALASGEVIGGLFFGHAEPGRFGPDVERLVVGVAGQTAAAIDNMAALHGRARLAALVRRVLLAPRLPAVEGIEVGAAYKAADGQAGGDFYDVFPISPSRWGIVMGDMCGRGVEAASLTALTRYTVRTAARLGLSADAVLGAVNQAIFAEGDDERFCTAVYGLLEVTDDGALLTYANGGHPPVLVVRDGVVEAAPITGGLLGAFPDTAITERTIALGVGDVVVLHTDGVSEVRCEGEEFGDRCLHETVAEVAGRPAREVADELVAASAAFGGGPVTDDAAVLVLVVERP
jgi:GAF domain-containing protein